VLSFFFTFSELRWNNYLYEFKIKEEFNMKLLKAILTLILFSVTFIIIIAAEYSTLYLLSFPAKEDVERVHLLDCEGSSVCYADSVGFWTTDFDATTNMTEPKFMIRSWFAWRWWQHGMKWADHTYTYITEFVTPIIAPIYVANDMYLHYGVEPNAENIALILSKKTNKNYQLLLDRVQYALNVRANDYVFMTETEWLKEYNDIYNVELLIEKYNQINPETGEPLFAPYVLKFYDSSGNFRAVGMLLFYQIFLALILSVYFTYQNPIVINRNELHENEVEGRFLPRLPKLGKIGLGKRQKRERRRK